jgi:flagellar basal-body rod modification protein FlgD
MSEINNITSNPFLQGVAADQNEPLKSGEELGQDAFLKLMIAQLKHQDPLSPAENGEFIAQLAQFSSVEGITNLNTAVGDLAKEFRSSRALEASSLVGRQVEVNTNAARLTEGGTMVGTVELPSSTGQLTITVTDAIGNELLVKDLGDQAGGDVQFGWDGLDKNAEQQPSGTYIVRAHAIIDGETAEVPVRLAANVNSVSIGTDQSMTLNVDGIGQVPIDSVRRFL